MNQSCMQNVYGFKAQPRCFTLHQTRNALLGNVLCDAAKSTYTESTIE